MKYKKKEITVLKKRKKEIRACYAQKLKIIKKVTKLDIYGLSLGYTKQIL